MSQGVRDFTQRLNQCLDEMGAPHDIRERTAILSKMLDIPKFQARTILEGHLVEDELVGRIAAEFEVDPEWLSGKK